jgi:cobalt-zinc-cadmium efflux system membrane fusion protein
LLCALLLAAAIAMFVRYNDLVPARVERVQAVPTAEVRSGTIERTIRLTGTTVAATSVMLRAPYLRGRRSAGGSAYGLVLESLAESGTPVRKGDRVAAFDQLPMQNRLDDQQADRVERELRLTTVRTQMDENRAAHQQQIRVAKARMDKAALDVKTAPVRSAIQNALFQLALNEAKATYQMLLAQTKYNEAAARAEIRRAQLDLQEAQLEERRAVANVERMVVHAPIDGRFIVTEIHRGSEFSQIRAGDQLRRGQPYAQIVDARSLVVEATANQVDVEGLRIGARALVRFDGYSDLELPARVYSIGPLARSNRRRAGYVAEVPVFLKLERLDERLIPSLTVHADVLLDGEPSEGIIPREAVFRDAETRRSFAYVKTAEGWEKRELELGLANYIQIAVRSGVNAGERVALSEPGD